MKVLMLLIVLVLVHGAAWAEKSPVAGESNPALRLQCSSVLVTYDWNFNEGDHGFTTTNCDDGGEPVWEYGVATSFEHWGSVWVTKLHVMVPNNAGDGLLSPGFTVTDSTCLMKMEHGYNTHEGWEGGNVKVDGEVIHPIGGYPTEVISIPEIWYAWCVDGQSGFTGDGGPENWNYSWFDLRDYLGQEVQLRFDYGSDASVQGMGWWIRYVRVGSNPMSVGDHTPERAVLGIVAPNPFNPRTEIEFSLLNQQQVQLSVFDLSGKQVVELADQNFPAGTHHITWNGCSTQGRALPSGTYIVRLESDSGVEARKVMLVR